MINTHIDFLFKKNVFLYCHFFLSISFVLTLKSSLKIQQQLLQWWKEHLPQQFQSLLLQSMMRFLCLLFPKEYAELRRKHWHNHWNDSVHYRSQPEILIPQKLNLWLIVSTCKASFKGCTCSSSVPSLKVKKNVTSIWSFVAFVLDACIIVVITTQARPPSL